MITNVRFPYIINIITVAAFCALSAFIASRVLAEAPNINVRAPAKAVAHAVSQETYTGIIAWVSSTEIKITDNFGVPRVFSIDPSTNILVGELPVGSATYTNLHMLDHVRIIVFNDGYDERAETIVSK